MKTTNARAMNPRNQAAAAKLDASYRMGQCCAVCCSREGGYCGKLKCNTRPAWICDHFRPLPEGCV